MSRARRPVPPFEAFLEEHRAMVYRFLLVALGPAEADDCFQETFLSALRAYPRLRDGEHLDRWVLRVATRKAIDAHRARRRGPVPTPALEGHAVGKEPANEPAVEDAKGPLWDAVRSLPLRQRVALVQRHVLDKSYEEIAAMMGSTEETARANVYQGIKKLREVVKER